MYLFSQWYVFYTSTLVVQGVRTKQAIAELMQSPQFHQQLDSFTQVCPLVVLHLYPCSSIYSSSYSGVISD